MVDYIKVSTFKDFSDSDSRRIKYATTVRAIEIFDNQVIERNEKRKEIESMFPYSVVLEGVYPAFDFAAEWCWKNIGNCHGKCVEGEMSEYTGCPVVLATKHITHGWYTNKEGRVINWEAENFSNVESHSHIGIWQLLWLGKTGYDYGFGEFWFKTERDKDRFLAAVPGFTHYYITSQKYYKEKEMNIHKSKWGFHPCSKEISKKLRFLNGVYAKAQHQAGAWERWDRKLPENRVWKRPIKDDKGLKVGTEIVLDGTGKPLPWREPDICDLFHEKVPSKVEAWGNRVVGYAKDTGLGPKIILAARQARTPKPTKEEVKNLSFSDEEIDRLYNQAKEWLESR